MDLCLATRAKISYQIVFLTQWELPFGSGFPFPLLSEIRTPAGNSHNILLLGRCDIRGMVLAH